MSRRCYVCGKKPKTGNAVSHSLRRTKRKWLPNLQKVNILVLDKKTKRNKKSKEYVCTKCLKAGKVQKAI